MREECVTFFRPYFQVELLPDSPRYPDFSYEAKPFSEYTSIMSECVKAEKIIADIPKEQLFDTLVCYCTEVITAAAETGDNATALSLLLRAFRLYGKDDDGRPTLAGMWICEWTSDFCFINGLTSELSEIYETDMQGLGFSVDFFVSDFVRGYLAGRNIMSDRVLLYCAAMSDFDYRASKHYKDNTEICDCAIEAAVTSAILRTVKSRYYQCLIPSTEHSVIKRWTYRGLPCAAGLSKHLQIYHTPFSKSEKLQSFVTSVVKYTDNLIRQALDVKTKLIGINLPPIYRAAASEGIRKSLPGFLKTPAKVGRKPKNTPPVSNEPEAPPVPSEEYELNVDFERAKRIETDSWKLCSLLGTEYGDEKSVDLSTLYGNAKKTAVLGKNGGTHGIICVSESFDTFVTSDKPNTSVTPDTPDAKDDTEMFYASLDTTERYILLCILAGESSETAAEVAGGFTPGFVASINEKASEIFGDIIIEETSKGFSVIEDYREDIKRVSGMQPISV